MVKSYMLGSELIALRVGMEILKGLRYKLQMMGVPLVDTPYIVWFDNKSVVKNISIPESTLKKKCVAICCHPSP